MTHFDECVSCYKPVETADGFISINEEGLCEECVEDELQWDTKKVAAVNFVNATANSVYDELVNVFRPLVGTKIVKWKDRKLKEEVKELVPDIVNESCMIEVFVSHKEYNLFELNYLVRAWPSSTLRICHSTIVCIGHIEGAVLKEIHEQHEILRTDYTIEELLRWREIHKRAPQEYRESKKWIETFGY